MDKFVFLYEDNIKVFYQLTPLFLVATARHVQNTQNSKFPYLYNIWRSKGGMKLAFCMQINIKLSYKLMLSILVGIASHAQII